MNCTGSIQGMDSELDETQPSEAVDSKRILLFSQGRDDVLF